MEERDYIVFTLGSKAYGIESSKIKEIGRTKEISINPVPKTAKYIKGIINLRGDVVPVIDLHIRFDLTHDGNTLPSGRILIVHIGKSMMGLLVDQIIGHRVIPLAAHIPPTQLMQMETPFLTSIVKSEQVTFFVVDPERAVSNG